MVTWQIPNRTFLVRFAGISSSFGFGWTMSRNTNHGSTKRPRYAAEEYQKGTIRSKNSVRLGNNMKYNGHSSFFVLVANYLGQSFDWNERKFGMGRRDAMS